MCLIQKLIALVVLSLFFCVPLSGQTDPFAKDDRPVTGDIEKTGESKVQNEMERIHRQMEKPVNLIYDQAPWSDVHEHLQKDLGFNIILTMSAKDDSLTEDEPITCNLTNLSCKRALRLMLRSKNATFVVQDDVLKIISLDDADDVQYFSTQIFNIRSLLTQVEMLEKGRIGRPKSSPKSLVKGASPVVGSPKKDHANANKTNKSLKEEVVSVPAQVVKLEKFLSPDDLISAESLVIDLVQNTISPDTWQTGQGLGTINIVGGCLTITNTQETIEAVTEFLDRLESKMSQH